jgi:hypothetical protein
MGSVVKLSAYVLLTILVVNAPVAGASGQPRLVKDVNVRPMPFGAPSAGTRSR